MPAAAPPSVSSGMPRPVARAVLHICTGGPSRALAQSLSGADLHGPCGNAAKVWSLRVRVSLPFLASRDSQTSAQCKGDRRQCQVYLNAVSYIPFL